ncbi:exported protein of unknown function [Methanocaldococcus lauensis]|nr:exported protein of unknown function [Methanocaldococcus lauensis]
MKIKLLLLFISTLLCAGSVWGTVIDHVPYTITESGTYELTKDLSYSGDSSLAAIKIKADNVVLEGNGHVLEGVSWAYGVEVLNHKNITIKNLNIKGFDYGIQLLLSNYTTIYKCNFINNSHGLQLIKSYYNYIYLNKFINNSDYNIEDISSDNTNTYHSPEKITYIYNGKTFTNYLGNYYDDYNGNDNNGDGIGDTPYTKDITDNYPLVKELVDEIEGSSGKSNSGSIKLPIPLSAVALSLIEITLILIAFLKPLRH